MGLRYDYDQNDDVRTYVTL